MKNRILVFGMTENPGGVESVIMNYYRNIDRTKIQFDFLCNTKNVAYEEEIKQLGGNIYHITARSKNKKAYKNDMKDFFEKNSKNYNTIWVNVCSLANIDYLKYAKKYGIKYRIIHSHNSKNMDSKLREILHKINRLYIKKYATDFWACGIEAGQWFYNKKILNSNKYLNINNAIEYEKFKFDDEVRKIYRKKFNIENKLAFGNVGRLHFQKNQSFLIDIFYEIQKSKPDSILLLVGQGEDYEKLKEKVKKLNILNKVKFLGVRNDVNKIMQAMDVFIFPSVFEGLGLVLVEAQASNLLVYASKDVIPKNVKINEDRFEFISLSEKPIKWSNKIIEDLEKINERDRNNYEKFKESGYDIITETEKIQNFFERS